MSETDLNPKPNSGNSFNYKITQFFLNNTRLTILTFILVIIVGLVATISSKTTGFPSPEIGFSIVQTTYPGASSETVEKEVTEPIEGAIKGIDGVKTFSSVSNNSVSIVSVTLDQSSNYDSVRNKIDSAVKSVVLPVGADAPKVTKPEIGGASYVFSVSGPDISQVYDTYTKAVKDLNQFPETAQVTPYVDLRKQAVIKLDLDKMKTEGITVDQVESQIKSFGESLPVVSGVALDDKSYSIVTTVSGSTLDDVKNLEFTPTSPATTATSQTQKAGQISALNYKTTNIKLSDFSDISTQYNFVDGDSTSIAYRNDTQSEVTPAVVFDVKAATGTDLTAYLSKINDKFSSYSDSDYLIGKSITDIPTDKTILMQNYSINDQNNEQVNEVVSGLIGSKLSFINGPAANIGWILGGIQLVFLVMLAFVSWRAAIIAAISIPFSLVFSIIYLYIIGESLNTLVLFSLVLVIGLVVDPALVILEAIQRKVDTGLKGKEAVLEAVKDVGNGLFLATVTNIIIFLPFGLISGLLGQIFIYIPMTIIPATVGSYIVPLVFLAWLGGLILKPSKNKSESEEENLWPIAKWLVNLNSKILNGSRWVRVVIIAVALIVPLSLTAYFFSTGQMKVAEFATTDNNNAADVTGSFLPTVTQSERESISKQVFDIIIANNNVLQAFPFASSGSSSDTSLSYYVQLKDAKDRSIKSVDIVKDINTQIQNKFGDSSSDPKFFDISADLEQTGPPTGTYQVSISVQNDNLTTLQTASISIGNTIKNVCLKDKNITIDETCDGGQKIVKKVDDGYTGKQNKVIEVLLDRQKLQAAQLTVPNAPLSAIVNQDLKQMFGINNSDSLITLQDNGSDLDIVLDKTKASPTTVDDIKNTVITNLSGQPIKLSDVADISEKSPKSSIQRVKGQTIGVVQAGMKDGYTDQGTAAQVTTAIVNYYADQDKTNDLGLEKGSVQEYSEGDTAANTKSFTELLVALVMAIFLTYVVLALFFQSFTLPLVVLYTIPLTFLGMFPALVYLGTGQIGFLEIIGTIILIGIVENVAIFLIDAARQKINREGWDEKKAISFASGVRLRPVIMTKFTAIASLAPLAVLSQFYRSIALVIMFGLLTSGFLSLVTTPILFVFFRWLSRQFAKLKWYNKILFFPLFPIYIIALAIRDKPVKQSKI
jgi:HAE1 family hydrophobic/amphiphilic exporter-1